MVGSKFNLKIITKKTKISGFDNQKSGFENETNKKCVKFFNDFFDRNESKYEKTLNEEQKKIIDL